MPDYQKQNLNDYSQCPIPATHRKLAEAHLLWHQALLNYQDPDAFRANLNATIQALRNITFALQSEGESIPNFVAWYGDVQKRLKADPDAKWLHNARTRVVHQGDLEMTSLASLKILTWKDEVLGEAQVPPNLTTWQILDNMRLPDLVNDSRTPPADLRDAAIEVERKWSLEALRGREILEVLAGVYGLLGDVVLDAHSQANQLLCIPSDSAHSNFRSSYHRTGTLTCMAVGREQRIERAKLSTGQIYEVVNESSYVSADDLDKAAKRYKFSKSHYTDSLESRDPIVIAENILSRAKQILKKDKYHSRMIFIRDGYGAWQQCSLDAADRTEKHILMRVVASFIESVGADALIDVSEAWYLPEPAFSELMRHEIKDAPSRKELLQVVVATCEGIRRVYTTHFERGLLGRITLGETDQSEDAKGLHYLMPVFAVWRRQRTKTLSDGEVRRRVWEPDGLDICFCGGPKRFIECCRPQMEFVRTSDSIDAEIRRALDSRDAIRAEELARASFAQYVIWIKQHTAPTRHVAEELHRDLVNIDLLAVQFHVRQLTEVLTLNGHEEAIVPALRHVSRVVGVPEISVRLAMLVAQSLWQSGDIAGAISEVRSLGKLENINDTLGLLLATKLLDLPSAECQVLIRRAIAAACCDAERVSAKLELTKYFQSCGEKESALCELDSAISDASSDADNSSILADARVLRWKITKSDEDFRAARAALETIAAEQNWRPLASLLLDHGDYDDAEVILTKPLEAGDITAHLLAVDLNLRRGTKDSARKLFLAIPANHIPPDLSYPFAYSMGLVALMCNDKALRQEAASRLEKIPSLNTPSLEPARTLLAALSGE